MGYKFTSRETIYQLPYMGKTAEEIALNFFNNPDIHKIPDGKPLFYCFKTHKVPEITKYWIDSNDKDFIGTLVNPFFLDFEDNIFRLSQIAKGNSHGVMPLAYSFRRNLSSTEKGEIIFLEQRYKITRSLYLLRKICIPKNPIKLEQNPNTLFFPEVRLSLSVLLGTILEDQHRLALFLKEKLLTEKALKTATTEFLNLCFPGQNLTPSFLNQNTGQNNLYAVYSDENNLNYNYKKNE